MAKRNLIRRFFSRLRRLFVHPNVPAVEYALLLAMIVLISATTFQALGPRVKSQFTKVSTILKSAAADWQ